MTVSHSYSQIIWQQFKKNKIGFVSLCVFCLFVIVALYAPFLASSKPIFLIYKNEMYFPLFRYLFYTGFFTKRLDLFYNILLFIVPLAVISLFVFKGKLLNIALIVLALVQMILFAILATGVVRDPASDSILNEKRYAIIEKQLAKTQDSLIGNFSSYNSWDFDLKFMNDYAKLNMLIRYLERKQQNEALAPYEKNYMAVYKKKMPTLWEINQKNYSEEVERLQNWLNKNQTSYQEALKNWPEVIYNYRTQKSSDNLLHMQKTRKIIQDYRDQTAKLQYLKDQHNWLINESQKITTMIMPLIRNFHWEDDAGGSQEMNKFLPWWELSRINRKDLAAALIFGVRISLVVGVTAVALALLIGIPIGTTSGYFAGSWDIAMSRLVEIWEAMPVFFMLLLVVAITQNKSIFIVIATIGIFGWTGFSRFMRGEVLRQRNLPYVLACHNLGFNHARIMFSHILPNAIPPILTLLPFAMMGAITSEAALSFLGLGEDGSCSWGVLMDEGRSVFPGESYLLWPPAILLSFLLISIALVGDTLRDALDPRLR